MARKMKDSGIEWIGEIPEGWSVSKVLHCLSMPITDGPHTTPTLYDTGIPFVSAEAVSCGNGIFVGIFRNSFIKDVVKSMFQKLTISI